MLPLSFLLWVTVVAARILGYLTFRQTGFRLLMTAILFVSFVAWVIISLAGGNVHNGSRSGIIGPFAIGALFGSLIWLFFAIRTYRSGVTLRDDDLVIRRIFWSRTVGLSEIDHFDLSGNVLRNVWFGALFTENGKKVRLPFGARSLIKQSPKNQPVIALMCEIADAINDRIHPQAAHYLSSTRDSEDATN